MPNDVNFSDAAEQPVPSSPTSTDGWGELENAIHEEHDSDKDGWDCVEPLEEHKPPPALANIQAAKKQPVTQPKAHAPRSASRPPNFKPAPALDDDDPWAAIAALRLMTKAKLLSLGRGVGQNLLLQT
ncbi:kinase family with ARM repeat domain-containing protein [Thalictrum thalictroides]|uniref:Kinase family with ARM repeat domain-containing protein n=1 Tax=Thalictrum thalictroides TaxID=46969 RepID=A0A7J6XFE6_THATH|nr:kinase family with ARM repeat domain-containing protein [Thalictrum thalictroides]